MRKDLLGKKKNHAFAHTPTVQQGVLFLKPRKIASGVAADFKAEDISLGIEPCDSVCLPLHVRRGAYKEMRVFICTQTCFKCQK